MSEAKAGDGLPNIERLFIKNILVPFAKVFFNWDNSLKMFQSEVKKIENLIKNIPEEKLQQRVKIDRIFGIENHSRDYSINMTLQHLTIVGTALIMVIDTLSKEQVIEKEVRIEDVKPSEQTKEESRKFFLYVKKYESFIKSHDKKVSTMKKKHPWFIEFNNKEWSTFAFIHTFVHRRQIEAIIKKLDN